MPLVLLIYGKKHLFVSTISLNLSLSYQSFAHENEKVFHLIISYIKTKAPLELHLETATQKTI